MFSSAEKLNTSGYLVRFTNEIKRTATEKGSLIAMGNPGGVYFFPDWDALHDFINELGPMEEGTGIYIESTKVEIKAV